MWVVAYILVWTKIGKLGRHLVGVPHLASSSRAHFE